MSTEVTPNNLSWGNQGLFISSCWELNHHQASLPDSVDNIFSLNFPKLKMLLASSYTKSLFVLAKPTGETQQPWAVPLRPCLRPDHQEDPNCQWTTKAERLRNQRTWHSWARHSCSPGHIHVCRREKTTAPGTACPGGATFSKTVSRQYNYTNLKKYIHPNS